MILSNSCKCGLCKSSFPTWLLLVVFLFLQTSLLAQNGSVKGVIRDSQTGESLIGASILIQGTTKGTITDLDGNFVLENVQAGDYNLVISYVSYEQMIQRTTVKKGETLELNIDLKPVQVELGEVKVIATRRTDTEMSMISSIRSGNVVASGISRQQISRSQDKDASEVISRVPGVTIRDGKYINVRGLDERYNVVWLNGTPAPSSEADKRAFTFDMIPSSMIDNIILLKTPAPEIPADFAGAVVQIQTKNTVDVNSAEISYSAAFRQQTTFSDFYTYEGGKYDWLGFDDGTRALPADFPDPVAFRDLADNPSPEDRDLITKLGREFNKEWTPSLSQARPDQSLMFGLNRKFLLGKISIGNVTSVNYSYSSQTREVFRAAYQVFDVVNNRPDTANYFTDQNYASRIRLGGLFNWVFVFGNNQKIEFRNFFNQLSDKVTVNRLGRDFYGGSYISANELSFQSRSIYSGQLSGNQNFRNSLINLEWSLGYGYSNNLQPDITRNEKTRNEDAEPGSPFVNAINFNADPKLLGRLNLKNYEHSYVAAVNYSHKVPLKGFVPEIKTGVYIETKDRDFTARNIGFAIANTSTFDWQLLYAPLDTLFLDRNINYTTGIKVDESTNLLDSYEASNDLYAGYFGINIPLRKIKVYAGVRYESNIQKLSSGDILVDNGLQDFFPSVNATYNVTEKSLIRLAYGRTINRPEFREIAPFTYYSFEEKASISGNPDLKNAYIDNLEVRFEFFPTLGDFITFGGFYKKFSNPIEAELYEIGSGLNYRYDNAPAATSFGLELDLRKSLTSLETKSNFLRAFRHLVFVFNSAIIRSEVKTDNSVDERGPTRRMQGQAPYIVNMGVFYDNPSNKLMISLLYNVIGERMMYVGNINKPHIYQTPRNLLDLTVTKRIGKYFSIKGGIKDILNQPYRLNQYEDAPEFIGDTELSRKHTQTIRDYRYGRLFSLGLSMNF